MYDHNEQRFKDKKDVILRNKIKYNTPSEKALISPVMRKRRESGNGLNCDLWRRGTDAASRAN